jgi:hypothetical protein
MSNEHASEMELQQYVLDKDGCSKGAVAHIELCEECQAGVAAYRLLFAEIGRQQRPAFDFDVSALLLPQVAVVPEPVKAAAPALVGGQFGQGFPVSRPDRHFRYLIGALIFFITGIPAYLFRKNIFYTFTGISSFFLYIIIAAALIIVLWRIMDMYKRYHRRLEALTYY